MKKGIDYIGITVSYIVYDPKKWFLCSLRSKKCRDEHNVRDLWWGWLKFGETFSEGIAREIQEELWLQPQDYIVHRLWIREFFRTIDGKPSHWVGIQHLIIPHDTEKVRNNEPEKHAELKFFPLKNLPSADKTHSQFYPTLREFKFQIESIIWQTILL